MIEVGHMYTTCFSNKAISYMTPLIFNQVGSLLLSLGTGTASPPLALVSVNTASVTVARRLTAR